MTVDGLYIFGFGPGEMFGRAGFLQKYPRIFHGGTPTHVCTSDGVALLILVSIALNVISDLGIRFERGM